MRYPRRIRLAPEAYADPSNVFHIVVRTHPQVGVLPAPVRTAIWRTIDEQRSGDRVLLHAACLMPDHLHLLLQRGSIDVIAFMDRWKSWSTRVAWSAGHRGTIWQPSFWDRAIRGLAEFDQVLEYIIRNPLSAGLVGADEQWPHLFVAVSHDAESRGG